VTDAKIRDILFSIAAGMADLVGLDVADPNRTIIFSLVLSGEKHCQTQ